MSTVTVTATTPPVIVVCPKTSLTTLTITMPATRVGLALGQHDVVLPPELSPRDTIRGPVGLAPVLAKSSVPTAFSGCANYDIHPPQVNFLL